MVLLAVGTQVYLSSDPKRELGSVRKDYGEGSVLVYWERTRRLWIYHTSQLRRP